MSSQIKNKFILSSIFLIALSFFLTFFTSKIAEPDNILHISYAELYKNNGITFSDFRWESNSVFGQYKSDIWYGYHLLLVPFVIGTNYLLSIQLAGFFITTLFLLTLLYVLHKFGVRYPLLWVLCTLLASLSELYRLINLRPQVLILALVVLFSYFLVYKRNKKMVFILSFIFSFADTTLVWLPFVLLFFSFSADLIFNFFNNQKKFTEFVREYIVYFLLTILAVSMGILFKPSPIDGIYLFYYQLVYLFWVKFNGVSLPWGIELYKMNIEYLPSFLPGIFLLSVVTIFKTFNIFKTEDSRKEVFILYSILAAIFFMLLMLLVSARALDFFMVFTVFSISMVSKPLYEFIPEKIKKNFLARSLAIIAIVTALSGGLPVYLYSKNIVGTDVKTYSRAADFLKKNTKPNSVVSYLTFSEYPHLFIWNKSNIYQNHSDPIFQYAYNPKVYINFLCAVEEIDKRKEVFTDLFRKGFDKGKCLDKENIDLVHILKHEMGADYFFIGSSKPIDIVKYMMKDSRAELVYFDDESMIFKI